MAVPPPDDLDPPPFPDLNTASLFFDFDGTLVELAPTPDGVVVDDALGRRLARLSAATGGRVAIVTGRSIAQIDALMGPHAAGLAIAGSHGAEQRTPAGGHVRPERSDALEGAAAELRAYAELQGLLFEAKTLGVTLHFRQVPKRGDDAVAMAEQVAARFGLQAHRGKMMVEVRLPGDKGRAIRALMDDAERTGTTPWFFGDDLTDEDGFAAALALGGAGVLIDPPRATAAVYRLDDVAALRDWIDATLAAADQTGAAETAA